MPPKRSASSAKKAAKDAVTPAAVVAAVAAAPSPKAKTSRAAARSTSLTSEKRVASVSPTPSLSPYHQESLGISGGVEATKTPSRFREQSGAGAKGQGGEENANDTSSGGLAVFVGLVLAVVLGIWMSFGGLGWGSDSFVFDGRSASEVGTRRSSTPTFFDSCGCYDSAATRESPLLKLLSVSKKGLITGAIAEGWGPKESTTNNEDDKQEPTKPFATRSGHGGGKKGFNARLRSILGIKSVEDTEGSTEKGQGEKGTEKSVRKVLVSECVRFYTLPTDMSVGEELSAFIRKNQDPAKQCHVWVLDDVLNTTLPAEPTGEVRNSAATRSGWSQGAWNGLKELFDQQTILGEGRLLANEDHVGLILVRSEKDGKHLRELGMPARVGFVMRPLRNL